MNAVTIVAVAGIFGAFSQWRKNSKLTPVKTSSGGVVNNYTTSINPKFILASIVVAFGIGMIADWNAKVGTHFAWLYLLGVVIVEGGWLLQKLSDGIKDGVDK